MGRRYPLVRFATTISRIASWTFVTNHTRVLYVIACDPSVRLRDIALALGITERATQRIVSELVDEGFLTRKRDGRRNTYVVHREKTMLTPQLSETEVGRLLAIFPADAPSAAEMVVAEAEAAVAKAEPVV